MAVAPEDIAVLLNPNARRVDDAVLDRIGELVDPEHLYVSEDEHRAAMMLDEIVAKGYGTIFAGGGDGTVTQVINQLLDDDGGPRVGILKLGTGNAMAEIVSSGDPMVDLQTYTANPSTDAHTLRLCEAEDTRFAFAGLGIDASILNDYRDLKARYGDGVMKPVLQNLGGYLAAALGVTIPGLVASWLRRSTVEATITNLGDTAHVIGHDELGGRIERSIAPGEVLYHGPANTVMFGTCPFYGYAMKVLPFAGLDPDRYHLRICNVPAPLLVANMGGLWDGSYQHEQIYDYHVDTVHIAFSEPMPYQMAGEAMGYRNSLTVGLSESSVELVRFI